jgi:hypothetical protein
VIPHRRHAFRHLGCDLAVVAAAAFVGRAQPQHAELLLEQPASGHARVVQRAEL